MLVRRIVHTLCGVVLLGALATTSAGAIGNAHRSSYFTFRAPVGLPGVTLQPGSYVFEVMNPESSANVVRVMNRDRSRTFSMQLTQFVHRPQAGDMKSTITLGESPNGTPQPIKTWFPDGETIGRAFLY